MKSTLKSILVTLCTILLSGCFSAPAAHIQKNVFATFGPGYWALKLPVDKPYIGSEWIINEEMPNKTIASGISDSQLEVEDSVNHLESSDLNKFSAKIAMMYNFGPSANAGFEISKSLETEKLKIVRPINIGDIKFKPEIPYITEAILVDNFIMNGKRAAFAGARLTTLDSFSGSAEMDGETGGKVAISGNKLVIAYKIQKIKNTSYKKSETMNHLTLAQNTASLSGDEISANLEYMERPFRDDVTWVCPEAKVKKDDIKSAWVVTLKDSKGDRPFAFPASTVGRSNSAIPGCKDYRAVISSEMDSNTTEINRVLVEVSLKGSILDPDRLTPVSANFDVILKKEAFVLELL